MMKKWFETATERYLPVIYALFFITALTSCSVFTDDEKKESIKITLSASSDINPNSQNRPAPLSIYIYELKAPDNFDNSDFYSIMNDTNNTLSQQSSKLYQAILMPGETRKIEVNPGKTSVALGIVAAYRNINYADWNKTIMLPHVKPDPWWKLIHAKESQILSIDFNKTSISTIKWTKM